MNELALFAGAGGGILGGKLLGWRTVCSVEIDPFCARRLMQRQNEGHLPPFPIWDDVCSFDGHPWHGIVDVVSGGFPCQDISVAGKGDGLEGERSGLWKEMRRIIGEVRPGHVLIENSPALTFRGGVRVVGELASMGYDCRWGIISAADAIWSAGDPCIDHLRERIWIRGTRTDARHERRRGRTIAGGKEPTTTSDLCSASFPHAQGLEGHGQPGLLDCGDGKDGRSGDITTAISGDESADTNSKRGRSGTSRRENASDARKSSRHQGTGFHWHAEPNVGRVAHGVAKRVDRLKAVGNGQVPAVVKLAWELLTP